MNRKQLTVLIVAGLVVGAAAIFISKNKDKMQATSNQRIGQQVVKSFPLNDVERVTVKHGGDQMNLTRKDGRWVLRITAADFQKPRRTVDTAKVQGAIDRVAERVRREGPGNGRM